VFDDTRDAWTDRLSEYVDGELDAAERAALDVHLQVCPACARTLTELRAVLERAGELEVPPPAEDLWPGIAARLPARERRVLAPAAWRGRGRPAGPRRWSFTLPQLAGAAAVLVLLSSLGVWAALTRRSAAPAGPAGTSALGAAPDAAAPAAFETTRYDAAIAELEQVLKDHRGELDPATVRVIEQNLRVVDQATAQARQALAADPASPYLNGHLATQLKRKLTLLRQATAAVAARNG
jgi:anti-sigma factor RsiW